MGGRLADALASNLNGDFDDKLELSPDFVAHQNVTTIDVETEPSRRDQRS